MAGGPLSELNRFGLILIVGSQSMLIHFVETLLLEGIAVTIGLFKTGAIRDDNPFRNGPLKTMTSSRSRWSAPTGTTEPDPLDHRTGPTDRVRLEPVTVQSG